MADFAKAYKHTARWEGGWVKDGADRGAETYAGISRRWHPDWEGWHIVDKYKNKKHGQVVDSAVLRVMVRRFYYSQYWSKMWGDDITSQAVAGFIFDWFVNSGVYAIQATQRAAGAKDDGIVGKLTVKAINGKEPKALLAKLKAARLSFVERIAESDPSQARFLKGWRNRINSF